MGGEGKRLVNRNTQQSHRGPPSPEQSPKAGALFESRWGLPFTQLDCPGFLYTAIQRASLDFYLVIRQSPSMIPQISLISL